MQKETTPGIDLLILLAITIGVYFVYNFIMVFVLLTWSPEAENPWLVLCNVSVFQLTMHVLVFYLFLLFRTIHFKSLITIQPISFKKMVWLPFVVIGAFISVYLLSQLSTYLFEYFEQYHHLENELQHQHYLASLFTHKNPLYLIISLFAFAVLPAIGEELIYRGILLKKLTDATGNIHFGVIASGLIFAAMHGLAVELLPIAFMGIILGYIYVFTKNIWYNIILHFIINALQILVFYFWPEIMVDF